MTSLNVGKTSKPLKIFFHAVDGIGHLNACVGIAQALVARGHKVYLLLNEQYKGRFVQFGIEEILIKKLPSPQTQNDADSNNEAEPGKPVNPLKRMSENLIKSGMLSAKSPLDKMKDQLATGKNMFKDSFEANKAYNVQIGEAIKRGKPDLFVLDSFLIPPSVLQAPCPWVYLCSAQPLCVFRSNGKLPPFGTGFATNSNPSTWEEYISVWKRWGYEILVGSAQEELDAAFDFTPKFQINDDITQFANSPYLNIYGYPEELDYSDVFPIPNNFVGVDAFMREIVEPFELPKEFERKPGEKLIYFSLGSMGSVDVELMKRILSVLGQTPHKYIVSKGQRGDEYDLLKNCWGENFLPQTRILPLVDLVITHGDNNTTTETFSQGKPMIVNHK